MKTTPFSLPIEEHSRQISHLAGQLSIPDTHRDPSLAVLYLHGFGSHQGGQKATFFKNRCLDAGLAFCSFDFQSHGASGGSFLDLTLSRNLDDIGRLHGHLRAEGFQRILLMGSSMGGVSALWYAALHPQDIVGTILIAPALELADGLLRYFTPEQQVRWKRRGKIELHHDLVSCELSWRLIEDLQSFDLHRLERLFSTPALIFQGKNDASVDWRKVVDFAASCPAESAILHLLMDGDHRLLEPLDHLWKVSRSFLEERNLV